jgi:hypothetical protein
MLFYILYFFIPWPLLAWHWLHSTLSLQLRWVCSIPATQREIKLRMRKGRWSFLLFGALFFSSWPKNEFVPPSDFLPFFWLFLSTLFSSTFKIKNPPLFSFLFPLLLYPLLASPSLYRFMLTLGFVPRCGVQDNLLCVICYLSVLSHLLHHVQYIYIVQSP